MSGQVFRAEDHTMQAIMTFPTIQAARSYRHEHGTGGWIFAPEDGVRVDEKLVLLFPPDHTPSRIFLHPMTRGRNGRLIGSA